MTTRTVKSAGMMMRSWWKMFFSLIFLVHVLGVGPRHLPLEVSNSNAERAKMNKSADIEGRTGLMFIGKHRNLLFAHIDSGTTKQSVLYQPLKLTRRSIPVAKTLNKEHSRGTPKVILQEILIQILFVIIYYANLFSSPLTKNKYNAMFCLFSVCNIPEGQI